MSLPMGLLAGFGAILTAVTAQATPIDYAFRGIGTGTLDGASFDGAFTVAEVGNTTGVDVAGPGIIGNATSGTFSAGPLVATLTGQNVVFDNTSPPEPTIEFAQQPGPASEGITNQAFETYGLTAALTVNDGTPTNAQATFSTSAGDLSFTNISALNFQATVPAAVPEPASLTVLGTALFGLAALRRRERRQI